MNAVAKVLLAIAMVMESTLVSAGIAVLIGGQVFSPKVMQSSPYPTKAEQVNARSK